MRLIFVWAIFFIFAPELKDFIFMVTSTKLVNWNEMRGQNKLPYTVGRLGMKKEDEEELSSRTND